MKKFIYSMSTKEIVFKNSLKKKKEKQFRREIFEIYYLGFQ